MDSMSLKRVLLTPDHRWTTMFAARDVTNVMPIIRGARHLLRYSHYRYPYDLLSVRDACVQSYRNERERLVNERVLGIYGMTLAEWRVNPANFGNAEVARINKEIEKLDVGVELIVFGYDSQNVPHMFTVIEPGTSEDRDHEAFVVIGSGGQLAQDSLLSRELPIESQAEMMCRVLEAKFCAEDDDGVGPDSCAGIINEPTSAEPAERFLRNAEMLAVKVAKENNKMNPYPDEVIKAVQQGIDSALTSDQIGRAVDELLRQEAARKVNPDDEKS